MKIFIALVLFFLIAVPHSFADSKAIFQLKDPHGDDHGDGTLILPTTGELRFGDLDLVSFSAKAEEAGTTFEVEFANPISRPDARAIDAGGKTLESTARLGFYTFNIDIYIDTDRKTGSGSTETLPGRKATIDPQFAWERVICVTPRPNETREVLKKILINKLEAKLQTEKGRVDPEDTSKVSSNASYDVQGSYFFPDRVRVSSRKISFFVPASFLGGTAKADWGYVILDTVATLEDRLDFGNFGGSETGVRLVNLPLEAGSWSDRLGTSRKEADLLPPILDMFVPEGMKQEDVLRNFNSNTKQMVVLPGVVPGPPEK